MVTQRLDRTADIAYIPLMLLAIDIGNTDTVVGIFTGEKLATHFRVASALNMTVDQAGLFILSLFNHHIDAQPSQVAQVAICSVVPSLTGVYEEMARKYFHVEPLAISSRLKLPFQIDYIDPAEVGADRLANAAAGYARHKKAVVVVDLGTAITFDVIAENGDYMGGVIAPGPKTAGVNLAQKAARLFEVRIEKPYRVIGKSTAEAIKAGLFHGTEGAITQILGLIFTELGRKTVVIATGGEAATYCSNLDCVDEIVPTLTLEGIRLIAEYNRLGTA